MRSFSIIICTYNPQLEIFSRLLNAIELMDISEVQYEIIIVDNNSTPALKNLAIVQSFCKTMSNVILVKEKKAGLTAARVTGIEHAQYDWVIFFDDDNEPASDYLSAASALIDEYKQTGAWGPGKLDVRYIAKKETPFLKKIKWLFQQRDYNGTFIDNNTKEGSEYYPFGTGMIIRKQALLTYVKMINNGTYTMSDRKEKSLSSAGDMQMLFTCILSGFYAGSSSRLKLNHLIDAKKATHSYAYKLVYALSSSHLKAYNEVFPGNLHIANPVNNLDVLKVFLTAVRSFRLHKEAYSLQMFVSKKLGELNGYIVASECLKKPLLLTLYEKLINV